MKTPYVSCEFVFPDFRETELSAGTPDANAKAEILSQERILLGPDCIQSLFFILTWNLEKLSRGLIHG